MALKGKSEALGSNGNQKGDEGITDLCELGPVAWTPLAQASSSDNLIRLSQSLLSLL